MRLDEAIIAGIACSIMARWRRFEPVTRFDFCESVLFLGCRGAHVTPIRDALLIIVVFG